MTQQDAAPLSPPQRRSRPRRSRLLLLLLLLVGLIGVAELALRMVGPYATFGAGEELPWMRQNTQDLSAQFVIDPEFGFRPRMGPDAAYNEWGTKQNPYTLQKPEGVTRLLFMGDSVTARAKPLAALAELYGTANYEYWNAGVESFSTVQEVNAYMRFNAPIAPDHVLLWFHVNDFQTTPVAFLDDAGKLVVYAPGRALDEIDPWLFEHSYLYRVWLGLTLEEGAAQASIEREIQASLRELKQRLAADDIPLSVVVLPLLQPLEDWTDAERRARTRILELLAEEGMTHFDLLPVVEQALAEGLEVQDAPGDFWHPNMELSRRFALHLAERDLLPRPGS